MSVPSATEFAELVVANATFPDPSNDTAPAVTSPVKLKFLAVAKGQIYYMTTLNHQTLNLTLLIVIHDEPHTHYCFKPEMLLVVNGIHHQIITIASFVGPALRSIIMTCT